MIGTEKPMDHNDWLRRIAADPSLDSLSRWQAGRILRETPPDKRSVAFYCPTKSFRKLFGSIPKLLEDRGIHVIRLYSERHLDDYENHQNAYRIFGVLPGQSSILAYLGFIDLFIVPTIMDCLPVESRKMLLLHTSFAGAPFPTNDAVTPGEEAQGTNNTSLSNDELVAKYTHQRAFWPLYDYISAPTPDICDGFEEFFQMYQQSPLTHPFHVNHHTDKQKLNDANRLVEMLDGKRLAESQCIIPLGYPSLDEGMHRAEASQKPRASITYAPTPVIGKEHWKPYVSIHSHGARIVEALLRAFPDRPVVFKPYADEAPETIRPIFEAGQRYTNFVHDQSGGNYHELYEKTSVMVSDFSSAAYTFSLAHLHPTIFFSHNETNLPPAVAQSAFSKFRTEVGEVTTDCDQLVRAVRHAIDHPELYRERIRNAREQAMFNPGNSARYFSDNIEYILNDRPHSDWRYYGAMPAPHGRHGNLHGDGSRWHQRTQRHHQLGNLALERAQADLTPDTAANAVDHLQRGIHESPDHEGVASALGQLERLLGRHTHAFEACSRAVELNPWDAANHVRLANTYNTLNMNEHAAKQMELAEKLNPNRPEGHPVIAPQSRPTNQRSAV